MVRVTAQARLHFGFSNLSLSHERLYGASGVALAEPSVVVEAEATTAEATTTEPTNTSAGFQSVSVTAPDGVTATAMADARLYAQRACDILEIPGATIDIQQSIPRHAGLGSGTQLALATFAAIAATADESPAVRTHAPALGRGGRSGIGVATFEQGGFVFDAGHPTARFTTDRPADGNWTVPAVAARHPIPDDWRFLLVEPDAPPGRSDDDEDTAMRTAVERAEPGRADRIAGIVTRRVLPAIAAGRAETFGAAVAEVGRLNGAWYADEQGGVYRPPVGDLVASLEAASSVFGAGQSSWGPTVYGVTDATHADAAHNAGERALSASGVDGSVRVVRGRNEGALIER